MLPHGLPSGLGEAARGPALAQCSGKYAAIVRLTWDSYAFREKVLLARLMGRFPSLCF